MIDFFCRFQSEFFRTSTAPSENSIMISITKIGTVEPVTLKKPCLFHADFNHDFNDDFKHDFNHEFLHSGTWLADFNHDFNHYFLHSGTPL